MKSRVRLKKCLEKRAKDYSLAARPGIGMHWVDYPDLVADPLKHAHAVASFLGGWFHTEKMAEQVSSSLFRNR